LFSTGYRHPIPSFGSNWFQFQPANTCLAQRSVRRVITRSLSLIQGSVPFPPVVDYYNSPIPTSRPALTMACEISAISRWLRSNAEKRSIASRAEIEGENACIEKHSA